MFGSAADPFFQKALTDEGSRFGLTQNQLMLARGARNLGLSAIDPAQIAKYFGSDTTNLMAYIRAPLEKTVDLNAASNKFLESIAHSNEEIAENTAAQSVSLFYSPIRSTDDLLVGG